MLTETDIQRALHAARVIPIDVANPHGPLGLEQLAGAVARIRGKQLPHRIERSIALRAETWDRLDQITKTVAAGATQPPSATQVAAALLERLVAGQGS